MNKFLINHITTKTFKTCISSNVINITNRHNFSTNSFYKSRLKNGIIFSNLNNQKMLNIKGQNSIFIYEQQKRWQLHHGHGHRHDHDGKEHHSGLIVALTSDQSKFILKIINFII